MDYGIEGRVALVAASSKGLGKACAMSMAREGANVALCARNDDELQNAAQEIKNLSLNRNNLPVRDDSSGQLQQGDMGRMVFLEPNQELAKPVEP